MVTVLKVVDDRTDDQRRDDFLNNYPDKFVACRVEHDWPKLRVGRQPKSVRVVPQSDGCFMLVVRCKSCGREKWRLTGPRGIYDPAEKWHYREPADYRAPKGLGLTKADYVAELYRRVFLSDPDMIRELDERVAEAEAEERAVVAQPKFSG